MRGALVACAAALAAATACSGPVAGRTGSTPAPRSARPSAGGATAPVTAPMKVVSRNGARVEFVPVTINGHGPYTFVLDTGAAVSSVSKKLASQLHLRHTGATRQVRGVNASSTAPLVAVPDWKVGNVELPADLVTALPLAEGSAHIAGLLGSDELGQFASVTLDFRHRTLRLAP